MNHNLDNTLAVLDRTPATLNALLRGLPDSWTLQNEGEKTWTPYDVIGHLIYADRTAWMPRARMILERGDAEAFAPLDRTGQARESEGKSLAQLLDEFAQVRAENVAAVRARNLHSADFERKGKHPAFGPVTLSELLSAWTVHDLTHLHQISRVMAHQYRAAVGPYNKYLGVLKCAGHSE
jgi:hypothetical protein